MPHPGSFEDAGVPRSLIHIQEHLQANQVQIDQILKLNTSFLSVSARLALERVIKQCLDPCAVVLE